MDHSSYKSKPGQKLCVWRWVSALRNSLDALRYGWQHESAVREELVALLASIPLAFLLADAVWKAVLMIASIVFVLLVEVLNTAIEALADRISTEHHPLIKVAKDMGSLAVLLAVILAVLVWGCVLWL